LQEGFRGKEMVLSLSQGESVRDVQLSPLQFKIKINPLLSGEGREERLQL
jgi:hypothetical protein